MDDKVNLAEKLAQLDGAYQPGIVGYLNDYKLVVVKTQGEFVWHKHDDTDDFFLVLKGRLTIQLRDRDVTLGPGELFVVPRGPTRRRTCSSSSRAARRTRATRAASARSPSARSRAAAVRAAACAAGRRAGRARPR